MSAPDLDQALNVPNWPVHVSPIRRMNVQLRKLKDDDLARIVVVDGGPAWKSDSVLLSGYLVDQENERRMVLLAFAGQEVAGYGTLLWESSYQPFRIQGRQRSMASWSPLMHGRRGHRIGNDTRA